jgi:uncharacterized membrane protein YdcZ (DUF606 family)
MNRTGIFSCVLALGALGLVLTTAAAPIRGMTQDSAQDGVGPDLEGVEIVLTDLPPAFHAMAEDQLSSMEGIMGSMAGGLAQASLQNLTGYSTNQIENPQYVASGLLSPLTPGEETGIDTQLSGSGTVESLGEAFGGEGITMLDGAGGIGNTHLAFSMVVSPLRLDYVVARRGPVLIEVAVMYLNGKQPLVNAVDLARILDERAIAVVGTDTEIAFRPTGPLVPEITTYIPTPLDVSTEPGVIGTNLLLAALMMLPFAVAAGLFTRTLAEHEDDLRQRFKPVDWLARLQDRLGQGMGSKLRRPVIQDLARLLGVVLFYGLVFSLLDRTWNPFSITGLVLFLNMTVAYGVVGIADDILQWRALREWGIPAEITVRPTNFLVSVTSTLTSRLFSLVPGLMFGTPEALRVDESLLDQAKRNRLLKISAITFLVVGFGLWLTTVATSLIQRFPLPINLSNLIAGLEGFLLVVFAVALENTFVRMLGFSGGFGQALKQKSRWLWIAGLVGITFVFYHTLINPRGELAEALKEANVIVFFCATAIFVVVAFGLWLYFRNKDRAIPHMA